MHDPDTKCSFYQKNIHLPNHRQLEINSVATFFVGNHPGQFNALNLDETLK